MALTQVSRGLLSTSIDDNGTSTAITIDSSQNVGIGTTSPTGVLTSYKSSNGDPKLGHFYNDNTGSAAEAVVYITNSSSVADGLFLQTYGQNGTTAGGFVQDASIIGSGTGASGGLSIMTRANADMRFYTNGHTNERMRIDASGNVGIGTTTVGQFASTNVGLTVDSGNAYSGIAMTDGATTSTLAQGYSTTYLYNQANGSMLFGTNNTERMRITSAGQLFLNLTAEVAAGYIASIKCAAGTGGVLIQNSNTTGVPLSFRNTSGSGIGSVSTTNTATAYNTSSDQRLKENIVDSPSASDDIDAIQVRSFDWKADGSHQKYGMVAQELLTVAPEAVSQGATEDDMMGVDYSKLVPMMIKEIQNLRREVAALKENN
jgi:hypothetical protein